MDPPALKTTDIFVVFGFGDARMFGRRILPPSELFLGIPPLGAGSIKIFKPA